MDISINRRGLFTKIFIMNLLTEGPSLGPDVLEGISDAVHYLLPEAGSIPQPGLVVVQRVVEVGERLHVELVQAAQVVKQGLQRLLDGRQLKEPEQKLILSSTQKIFWRPVNHDVKNRYETQTHVAVISRQGLKVVILLREDLRSKLLRVFVMDLQVLLVPVLLQVVVWLHGP